MRPVERLIYVGGQRFKKERRQERKNVGKEMLGIPHLFVVKIGVFWSGVWGRAGKKAMICLVLTVWNQDGERVHEAINQ